MKKTSSIFLTVLCGVMLGSCDCKKAKQEVNIVPLPVSVQVVEGNFKLTPKTVINVVNGANDLTPACDFFRKSLSTSFGTPLTVEQGDAKSNAINISIDPSMKEEAYDLNVSNKSVDIKAGSSKGVFYAFQSLRQMLPANIEKGEKVTSIEIQNVNIQDEPRFEHRGIMLDVARHMSSVDEIKTFIDMLAMHKLNRFHWHLTDDQGWRIEIKKYPELTKVGSMRTETVIGKNSGKYDEKPYGGFYTQDEVKEIVQYAADRYITVIPEIELPGHAVAALTSYPSLGCTGGPYEVMKEWGISDQVFCAGNEKTFEFLQDVFDEVIPLFPSEYIHIGGDECPKVEWKKCPKCQAKIKAEKLKNEYELQSYFVHRMEQYLNSKGKKIIGWDEIMEGGVSKTATIMSWRGTKGGIEAAKLGNQVIMAPNNYVYLDYYQSRDQDKEPFSIGGFVDVAKVYSLDPTSGMTEEEGKMITGVQANLWREYIKDFSHVQYMLLPRMAALSEVAWTPVNQKEYNNFVNRAITLADRYEALGYNFAKHIFSVNGTATANEEKKCLELTLAPNNSTSEIHYTTDGTTPTSGSPLYSAPIEIKADSKIHALLFREGKPTGTEYDRTFKVSKAAFKDAKLLSKTSESYSGKGARTLADGLRGTQGIQNDNWLGTNNDDIVLVVDFGTPTEYSQVTIGTFQSYYDWILAPTAIKVYASEDGNDFQEIAVLDNVKALESIQNDGLKDIKIDIANGNSRFVKVIVEREKVLPAGHPEAGKPAHLFVDEIEIY